MKSRYALPSSNATHPVRIEMSKTVRMTCTCRYHGFAKTITGRTPKPLHVCPECRRVAQFHAGVR